MRSVFFLMTVLISFNSFSQVVLNGIVKDTEGEGLPLAHVSIFPDSVTTATDNTGQYQVTLSPGNKILQVSYVGYEFYQYKFYITTDTTVEAVLTPSTNQLREVVISGQRDFQQEIFESNRTSTHVLTQDNVTGIPVLGGEADVIKTLQLLPGTLRGIEGTSDLFVR
ncbi:MAG TPA: carboxypeptidase-like regulatory domain-containing protein, partial [Ohtaekwangia sp.]|nr:carboxypeptidase-like regulatory domain-containing protein [Ohtaekwangia sp.]